MGRGEWLALVLVVAVLSAPFLLARMSPHRGVRRGGPSRHPFRLPSRRSWGTGQEDRTGMVEFDLPPIEKR